MVTCTPNTVAVRPLAEGGGGGGGPLGRPARGVGGETARKNGEMRRFSRFRAAFCGFSAKIALKILYSGSFRSPFRAASTTLFRSVGVSPVSLHVSGALNPSAK